MSAAAEEPRSGDPMLAAAIEIADLRALEASIERDNARLDRLQRELSFAHPAHLVIFGFMPAGTWAELPAMWQSAGELRMTPRMGLPPRDWRGGAIAVAADVAERIVRQRVGGSPQQ